MKIKTFNFTAKTFGLALAATLALLVGVGSFSNNSGAFAQTGAAGELPSATSAKQELAKIPTARIAQIKNARVRDAAQQVVASLQAMANNKEASREAALFNAVNQNADKLAAAGTGDPAFGCISDSVGGYRQCKKDCKASGYKFCGCLADLVVGVVKCALP